MTETVPSCCVEGSLHAGSPKGTIEELYGLMTYVSPAGGSIADKAGTTTLVFLSDAFGLADDYPNAKLLADEYAAKGYRVLLPDVFGGDPLPASLITKVPTQEELANKSFIGRLLTRISTTRLLATVGAPWLLRHRDSITRPIVNGYLKAVRADPAVKHVVAVGFCFGGKYALVVANGPEPLVDAALAFHPSRVAIPADLKNVAVPTLITIGDQDEWMSVGQVRKAEAVFAGLRKKDGALKAEVKVYEGAKHGFAIRGNLETDKERAFRERALADGLAFLAAAGL